ncbi:hypothetical protein INT48_007942 [Thamnidium elegans]|uniref:RNA polymerase II elongation factor ELL N-terminal domain-containing protein n=1 Tax=Thamnidium elegans TaxID=101142 RepID=A0A8H7VUT1_9FUNG|nr:hypothetical protein INT48_007942 [Thamnidium elegans]
MSKSNHTVNFKLDPESFAKLASAKNIKLDVKNNEMASSSLYYLGDSVSANTSTRVLSDIDKKRIKTKEREKTTTRGVELLDIPSMPTTISPSSPIPPTTKPMKSTLKKSSTGTSTSNNNTSNNNNNNITKNTKRKPSTNHNIPTSRGSLTPQNNTPRPSTNPPPPTEKLNDRIIQLLALKPYQVTTMAKMVDSTQWEVKKIMDEVGIQLLDQAQKKKYCLKPTLYKNIKIWDWPLYTNEEKMTVCDNAKEAYDILHLPADAVERNNLMDSSKLIQPPPGRVPITTERDRAIAAKKSSNKSLKKAPEKKHSSDLKGKGKTTPSGFSYSTGTEPAAPTPSSKITSPITNTTKNKPVTTTTHTVAAAATAPTAATLQRSSSTTGQHHLKPSSSNKKVGAKGLPQPAPPTITTTTSSAGKASPTATKSSSKLILPIKSSKLPSSNKHVKRSASEAAIAHQPTSSKKIKTTDYSHHHTPIELSQLATQPIFDSYCAKYMHEQKEYHDTKVQFKQKYPYYIKVLESTHPPTGSKRSYFDLKLEYYDMVKENYLKKQDESSWQEAETHLRECNAKRRRLNFMWNSIEKNLNDHHYKLNRKM